MWVVPAPRVCPSGGARATRPRRRHATTTATATATRSFARPGTVRFRKRWEQEKNKFQIKNPSEYY